MNKDAPIPPRRRYTPERILGAAMHLVRTEGIDAELGMKMLKDFQEGEDTILRTDAGNLPGRLEALVKLGYLLRGDHLSEADPPVDSVPGSRP